MGSKNRCPVDKNHKVEKKYLIVSPFYYCTHCLEDIFYLKEDKNFSLILNKNPYTNLSTIESLLTTMLAIPEARVSLLMKELESKKEISILKVSDLFSAKTLVSRANNWLNHFEPISSLNKKRNLVISIKQVF